MTTNDGEEVYILVPLWEKSNLTLKEAAEYTGIGINKLRDISNGDNCPFVLWVGGKRLLKRKQLDEYLAKSFSI
jgi:excisionase family DNA binding protein